MAGGKPWFGQKRYGMGLGPASWQGWLTLLAYIIVMGWTVEQAQAVLGGGARTVWILLGVETLVLLVIIFLKGDRRPWRWRWGGE